MLGVLIQNLQAVGSEEILRADADGLLHSLGPYLDWLKEALHLTDYRFDIVTAEGDGSKAAWIDCLDARRRSKVSLTLDFFAADDAEQRHILIHELVHRILHDIRTVAGGLAPELGRQLFGYFKGQHDLAVDEAVDWLTDVLCGVLPTPREFAAGGRPGVGVPVPDDGDGR